MRLTEMLCDVILWTSAPVLNNRGNGSRPGMMFTMTHTGTYTDTHTDLDTHTDTIQTDTYTDIRQIILTEMLCDVILWTSAPVLNKRGNGSRPGMMFTVSHTGVTYRYIHLQTDTYRYI